MQKVQRLFTTSYNLIQATNSHASFNSTKRMTKKGPWKSG